MITTAGIRPGFSKPDAARGIDAGIYRRKKRYDRKRLSSLENKRTVPKRKREPGYSREPVRTVRAIREANPAYSGKRYVLFFCGNGTRGPCPVCPTPGRLINREYLFFRPDTKGHTKRSKAAQRARERTRKPCSLKADGARQLIGFGMKHVYL